MRIDLTAMKDQPPELGIDGQPASKDYPLRWKDALDLPFTLLWLNHERQYDIELWVNGTLRGRVPPKSPAVDAIYDADERGIRQEDHASLRQPWTSVDDTPHASRLSDLRAEIAASSGQRARLAWDGVDRTLAVHERNSTELDTLLEAIETDKDVALELFQNVRPPVERDEILGLLDQRLHNFAASAASLVDHTRRLFDGYEGTHLASEYGKRKEALRIVPVVGFVKDLRTTSYIGAFPSSASQLASANRCLLRGRECRSRLSS
ncbi:MAG: hypothetical protein ABI885_30015 [Gammaproteobacteria bacterium]